MPGDSERKLAKAAGLGTDVCIADLEDGVAPEAKGLARSTVPRMLPELDWGKTRLFVRIDPAGDPLEDVAAAVTAGAHGIVVPKASHPDQVSSLADQIRQIEPELELALILTEDAVGVREMDRTLDAVPDVVAAFFGTEDLAASLGVRSVFDARGRLVDVLETARSLFRLATGARGVPAVDTPHLAIDDLEGVRGAAAVAAAQGFVGKQVIHPSHVPIVNEAFVPDAGEVARARDLVDRFEQAGGGGAIRVGNEMADPPHLKRARSVLALADLYQGDE